MIKTLARSIREYKACCHPDASAGNGARSSWNVSIPFVIANLVNEMQAGCSMGSHCPVRRGPAL